MTTTTSEIVNDSENKFNTVLFLPKNNSRKGEGGLRTKGYFKKSLDGKPLVSVITVVLNGCKYLEQTIQSVLNQSYENVEYIVIDGGSTDGTIDIIRKYEHAIDYWVSEPDKGIYDAMNKGIALAVGDWIYFLGCDDILIKNALININLQDYETNRVVYGDVYMPHRHRIYDGKFSKYKLMLKNICHQSVFYGKDTIKGKLFDLSFNIFSDHDMNIKLFAENNFIYRPVLVCIYNDCDGLSAIDRDEAFHAQSSKLIRINFGIYYCSLFWARKFIVKITKLFHIKSAIKRVLSK